MSFTAGNQVGPYQIVELLGAGGMGEIYRARDPRIGREVAIKVIASVYAGDSQLLQRFEQEACAAGALNHPNILVIHDIGHQNGSPYLVSELLEGETLRERINTGRIPLKKVLDIAVQLTEGLAAAHERGIVHRDLKPDNVFLTRDGRVKILDFGLAKLTWPEASYDGQTGVSKRFGTEAGTILGTVGYMSPEQVRGERTDHRSDIFAFGAILYELLSGRRAFEGPTGVEKMNAILNEDPLPIRERSVPVPLLWVTERCLAKDPRKRYGATVDLNQDLHNLLDHFADISSTSSSMGVDTTKKKRIVPIVALTIFLTLIAALTGFLWMQSPSGIDLSSFHATRVSDGTRYEDYASWSPDGESIAYSAAIDGVLQIFTRRLDSPTATQLTHSPNDCRQSVWSPDGRRIYFLSSPDFDQKQGDLYVVGAAGGSPQKLAENVFSAAVSGDGKALFLMRANDQGSMSLWTASPTDATPSQYIKAPFDQPVPAAWMAFSPDGSRLGVFLQRESNAEFWTIPYPNGKPQRIASDLPTYNLSTFSWMLNDSIVFGGGDRLWLLDLSSQRHYPITSDTMDEINPAVSGGGRIVFTSSQREYDVIQVPLDGTAARDLVDTDLTEGAPAWSPDGKLLVYAARRNASDVLLLQNTEDGSEKILVTPSDFKTDRIYLSRVTFSPDGQRIAYKVWGETPANNPGTIFVSTINGGPPIPLLSEKMREAQSSPAWSPDGNWIVYIRASNTPLPKWDLMKTKVLSDEHPVLLKRNIGYHHPQWSPTGDWIACQDNDGFRLFSPDGKSSRILNNDSWIIYGWSKDGKLLYGVKRNEHSHLVLASMDIAGGAEQVLSDLGPAPTRMGWDPLMGFSLKPDGKSFATSVLRQKASLWIFDGIHPPSSFWNRLTSKQ